MSDFTDLRILGGLRRIGGGMDAHRRIKLPPVYLFVLPCGSQAKQLDRALAEAVDPAGAPTKRAGGPPLHLVRPDVRRVLCGGASGGESCESE